MKAYKILALLKRVEMLKAGDKRVLINGLPCKVDFRIIADDLFEDTVNALKSAMVELDKVKNCPIPDVTYRREQLVFYTKWLQDNYNFEYSADVLVGEYIEGN